MLKKTLLLGIGLLATQLYAHPNTPTNEFKHGVSIFHDQLSNMNFAIGLETENNMFEAGINFSANRVNPSVSSSPDYTEFYLGGVIGKRQSIPGNGCLSYGVLTNYGFYSNDTDAKASGLTKNPFAIGPYIGLAYAPNKNFELFTRIMPVSYDKNGNNTVEYEFFQEGQIGIKYFFDK